MSTSQKLIVLRRGTLHTLAAISLISLMLHITGSPAFAQTEARESYQDRDDPIEGSWIFEVNRGNQGGSFTALNAFTAGGVIAATGSMDKVNPVSPVFGSWKRIDSNRVSGVIYFFLFDAIGNPVGLLKTDEIFYLRGRNELSGAGSSFVCDVGGNNCSNHGTEALISFTGRRIAPIGLR